jgi:hypothetical protein
MDEDYWDSSTLIQVVEAYSIPDVDGDHALRRTRS